MTSGQRIVVVTVVIGCLTSAAFVAQATDPVEARWRCPYSPDGVCVPNKMFYGYYPTRWRRWPGHPQRALNGKPAAEEVPTPAAKAPSEAPSDSTEKDNAATSADDDTAPEFLDDAGQTPSTPGPTTGGEQTPMTAPLPHTDPAPTPAEQGAPETTLPDAGVPDAGLPGTTLPDTTFPGAEPPPTGLPSATPDNPLREAAPDPGLQPGATAPKEQENDGFGPPEPSPTSELGNPFNDDPPEPLPAPEELKAPAPAPASFPIRDQQTRRMHWRTTQLAGARTAAHGADRMPPEPRRLAAIPEARALSTADTQSIASLQPDRRVNPLRAASEPAVPSNSQITPTASWAAESMQVNSDWKINPLRLE